MSLLNVENVDKFCKTWLGSGDSNPKIIFFGIEFSSEARSETAITSFFREIDKLEYPELIADYSNFVTRHSRASNPNFDFENDIYGANNQTRRWLSILAYCILTRTKISNSVQYSPDFRNFSTKFANDKSETAALELFPLPCLDLNHFPYPAWLDTTGHKHFENKTAYKQAYFEERKRLILNRLNTESVENVIMYGSGNRGDFQNILGFELEQISVGENKFFYIKKESKKNYILINHPASFGFGYEYLQNVLKMAGI